MNAPAAAQDAMQGWLLQGHPGIAGFVAGDGVAHRLRIYADAYRLRLLDVLANDFPATKAALGDDAFASLAFDYLREHPSRQPSVRHFGQAFPNWLATRADASPGVHDLARFEWLQGECFDAADARALDIEDVACLPAADWPALRLRLHPAVRLLATRRLALRDGTPRLVRKDDPSDWLLWRETFDVHWRRLDADEAEALRALRTDASFGALCERLSRHHGEAGALRAATLLKRWLADGLLAAPDPACFD